MNPNITMRYPSPSRINIYPVVLLSIVADALYSLYAVFALAECRQS